MNVLHELYMYSFILIFSNYLLSQCLKSRSVTYCVNLKGTSTLMITMYNMKDLNKPRVLIPVSSISVEKRRSCGRLNISKSTVIEAAIV